MNARELMQKRAKLIDDAKAIAAAPEMTDEQRSQVDALLAGAATVAKDIKRMQDLEVADAELDQSYGTRAARTDAPNLNLKTRLGDSESRAFVHYLRTGDASRELVREQRASNNADMSVGTAAQGGYAVPTGFYNAIIEKRGETMLRDKLGCLPIPGVGTTTNVPVENGSANVFVATNEASSSDRDTPQLGQKAMTLLRYTKRVPLTVELLADEDAKIEKFAAGYVGRAAANTHNTLLAAEAMASGTAFALGAAAAATDTDISGIVYSLPDGYQDRAAFVMRRASEGAYRALKGSVFQFAPTPAGNARELWTYPIFNTAFVEAIATTKKSVLFGNWEFMTYRDEEGMTVLRDPYSSASTGIVNLHFSFRTVYKLSIAEAIRVGTHP